MDPEAKEGLTDIWGREAVCPPAPRKITRRRAVKVALIGAGAAACGGGAWWFRDDLLQLPGRVGDVLRSAGAVESAEVFKNDAPKGEVWELWNRRGWAREARHCLSLGKNVECKLCPNGCLLEPEDRGRCRNRVNKDGKLYTLVYGNPCAFHVDPIEKKPLMHFLPATGVFSIATSGCGFRCLNCQNWDISQRKPEELKDPRGGEFRPTPEQLGYMSVSQRDRMSLFPEDVVAVAERFNCPSIAYTYSEPTMFYEYMIDTSRLAHSKGIKNVWVTCGYINPEPLAEFCDVLDAANVDLKSFDDQIYKKLNSGKLQPILETLKTLKDRGVWFEVTNLLVPTYTDKMDMIRRMCDWLVKNVGPDYPLHFSRFSPKHKLTRLPPTRVEILLEARSIARKAGLHYVYIGNVRITEVEDAETTFCPECRKAVIERNIYTVRKVNLRDGKCKFCKTKIAGVWSA